MFVGFRNKFYTIAFLCGVVVMAMEVTFSRQIAPFFGTSLFVWTNLIGAVLIALAAGYYIGGYIAERAPRIEILLRLLYFSGLAFVFGSVLVQLFGERAIAGWHTDYSPSSLIFWWGAAVVVLVLPLVSIGMASPFLMKIYSLQDEKFGRVSGAISFAFTAGSIIGVYLPTFWLIPQYGTAATVIFFASVLIVMGVFGWKEWGLRVMLIIIAILSVFISMREPLSVFFVSQNMKILAKVETPYNLIRVAEDANGIRYMMFNSGLGLQSVYQPQGMLTGVYYDYFNLLPEMFPREKKLKILLIGLAGGTVIRQMEHYFPERAEITAVEIDQKTIGLSRQYFGLGSSKAEMITEDGRVFLNTTQNKYDVIIVDAFQNEFEIPWTMTTQEFWKLVRTHLTDDGIAAMNMIGRNGEDPLTDAIANTQAKVFDHTYVGSLSAEPQTNKMLFSSNREISFTADYRAGELALLASDLKTKMKPVIYTPHSQIFTDDRAPVEILTSSMLFGAY